MDSKEILTQLKIANEKIANLKDWIDRAPKIAAEECNRQKAELESRLREAEARANMWEHNYSIASPKSYALIRRTRRLQAALETIALWPFDIRGDCVADARKLAQAALADEQPAEPHDMCICGHAWPEHEMRASDGPDGVWYPCGRCKCRFFSKAPEPAESEVKE